MSLLLLLLLISAIKGFIQIFKQHKFKISNSRFKRRYVILNAKNPEEVSDFFTDEICSRILDYPSKIEIGFLNNCTILNFGSNEQLSFDSCNKSLEDLIEKINLFLKKE